MDAQIAKVLVDAMENAGEEVKMYEDYSGRGMFGRTTVGIVVKREMDVIRALYEYMRTLPDHILMDFPEMPRLSVDNMGMDIIIY